MQKTCTLSNLIVYLHHQLKLNRPEQVYKVCEKMMKAYLVNSPAYKYNGDNGMYRSIVITDDTDVPIFVHGDHKTLVENSDNIFDVAGQSFSDSDRIIYIEEVETDIEKMLRMALIYERERKTLDAYYDKQQKMHPTIRLEPKEAKGISKKERSEMFDQLTAEYQEWLSKNPVPKTTVPYYFFKK